MDMPNDCGADAVDRPAHVSADLVVDFDYFNPPYHHDDLHLAWKTLQDEAPNDVVWTDRNGGHWIVLRGRDMHDLLSDRNRIDDRILLVAAEERDFKMIPLAMRSPESLKYRAIMNYDLSPRRVKILAESIRRIANMLIDDIEEQGHCEFIAAFASKLPTILFMELCDLPMEDAPRLAQITSQLSKPDGSMLLEQAIDEIVQYLVPFVEQRRVTPGDDLLSRLANGIVDGDRVTFDEALSLTSIALFGGLDTVAASLGLAFRFLAENVETRRELLKDPSRVEASVDEIFRRLAVPVTGRRAIVDFEMHGAAIKAGDSILLPLMLHGLDEREYRDPLIFSLDRPAQSTSTFGNGYHKCPGQQLARSEMTIAIQQWMARIPDFEIEAGSRVAMTSGGSMIVNSLPLRWDIPDVSERA